MGCSESTAVADSETSLEVTKVKVEDEKEDGSIVLNAATADELMSTFWPILVDLSKGIIDSELMPALNSMSPVNIRLTKFTLGNTPPTFGKMTLTQPQHPFRLRAALPISWESDQVIEAVALSIPIGVRDLKIKARLLVDQGPILDKLPIIGGIGISMPEVPEIDFDLTGIANVAEIPGIRGMIFNLIQGAIASAIVLPNRIAIPLGKRADLEDPAQLFHPPPAGLLGIKIKSATNLPSQDLWDDSDPYVKVKVGHFAKDFKTKEKWNKKNPEWNEESKLFPVYAMCQLITCQIFDKDNLSWHDEIGEVRRIEVQDAIETKGEQDYQLYDAKGKQILDSFVRLSFDYKAVGALVPKPTGADDTLFVLLVAVDKLRPEKSFLLQDDITLSYRIDAEGEVLEQEAKKKPEILDKEKEQMKFVRNVLRKLEEKKLTAKAAAEITGLTVEEVNRIKQMHSATVATEYEMAHQVSFVLKKKDVDTKSVHLKLSSKEIDEKLQLSILENLSPDLLTPLQLKLKDGTMIIMRLRLMSLNTR